MNFGAKGGACQECLVEIIFCWGGGDQFSLWQGKWGNNVKKKLTTLSDLTRNAKVIGIEKKLKDSPQK